MILLHDEATWPKEIYELILLEASHIHIELAFEQAQRLEGKNWFTTIGRSKHQEVKELVSIELIKYQIKAWHCTKMLYPNQIIEQGLSLWSGESLLSQVEEALQTCAPFATVSEAVGLIRDFQNKSENAAMEAPLLFYLTEPQASAYEMKESAKYFGGAVSQAALYTKRFKFYPLLQKIGELFLVECRISLKDFSGSDVEELADKLIRHLVKKEIEGTTDALAAICHLNKPVPPSDILEVRALA